MIVFFIRIVQFNNKQKNKKNRREANECINSMQNKDFKYYSLYIKLVLVFRKVFINIF